MPTASLEPCSTVPSTSAKNEPATVVEISLLLPAPWAKKLVDQANLEKISVAQFLRGVIGDALAQRHSPLAKPDRIPL